MRCLSLAAMADPPILVTATFAPGDDGWLQELVVFSPAPGISGGTDEIQRNIIGERGLDLPKEPGHPRHTPFKDLPANATR